MVLVSIVCPIYNEEKFIENCIGSVLKQDYPKSQLEVFFVDGMSKDRTREIVLKYTRQYDFIHLLDNPEKIVPPALNKGIQAARGEVVIRIDGHCIYQQNYVSTLVDYLFRLKADNVGAMWNTLPARNTSTCKAIAIGASHKFGIGDSLHKVGVKKVVETDTVPFGCFKRDVFEKIGMFDNDLIRNQDDEFNARIIKSGGKIFLIPELVIDYYARDRVSKMAKMFYQYGLFKPLVNKKLGAPATTRQFFPSLFLCGIIVGGILSCFSNYILGVYLFVIVLYICLAFYFATKEAIVRKDWKLVFLLPCIFFIIHVSYGWGYWEGCYKVLLNKKIIVDINR